MGACKGGTHTGTHAVLGVMLLLLLRSATQ